MLFAVVQLVVVAWVAFFVLASVAASLAAGLTRRGTERWAPDARHRALLVLALSPMAFATASVLAAMSPSLIAFVWPAFDHCLVHPGHVHLCLVHLPEQWANPPLLVGLTFVVTILAGKAALGIWELRRASRLASRLVARASDDRELGAWMLPTAQPLCVLLGLFRPSILVSQGLVRAVNLGELRAVLEHERAHAQRHDTLLRLAARASTVFLLPRARRSLLHALDVAAEQSADEAGATALGDRLAMAEVILKVERLLHVPSLELGALVASFGGASVPLRVAALLEAPLETRPRLPTLVAIAAAVALFAGSHELHHATETLLGFIAH
jgi:Zn-dependent protease with chaperone function